MPAKKKQKTEPHHQAQSAPNGEEVDGTARVSGKRGRSGEEGDNLRDALARVLKPVTKACLTEALPLLVGTVESRDPAASFLQARQILSGHTELAPLVTVLDAVAQHVGDADTTAARDYLTILPACTTFDLLCVIYTSRAKEPLTHPLTVVASLCSLFLTVPLLEKPDMADVARHFLVPLQGCEPFFMQLADLFMSVASRPPSPLSESLQGTKALVLRNVSESGKTFKALAIVSGFAKLAETNERYAWLRERRVVPLYIGFNGTAGLTDPEAAYMKAAGASALECVLYTRIAAAAAAIAAKPDLVAVPDGRRAMAMTLRVTSSSVANLEMQHVDDLKTKAKNALGQVAQILRSPEGKPPLVVIVVDEGQMFDTIGGKLPLPPSVQPKEDGRDANGSRLALRLCRRLQHELGASLPVVGLMLGIDPQTSLSTDKAGENVLVSPEAELPTMEEFAAFVAVRLADLSPHDRAIISTVRYPRGRELPESLDNLYSSIENLRRTDVSDTVFISAVRASLLGDTFLVHGQRLVTMPYRGDIPQVDFHCLSELHARVCRKNASQLACQLLKAVREGENWDAFEEACGLLLTMAAEFVLTGTLAEHIGAAAFDFLSIAGFDKLAKMTFVDLRSSCRTNRHPFQGTTDKDTLSSQFVDALRNLGLKEGALFRSGGTAAWDFILVVNVDGTLHFRYADAKNANSPTAPATAVQDWHGGVVAAAKRANIEQSVATRTQGAVIVRVATNSKISGHVTLDHDSWRMGPMTEFVFNPKYFEEANRTAVHPTPSESPLGQCDALPHSNTPCR